MLMGVCKMVTIQKAEYADVKTVTCLAQQLWPHHETAELHAEFDVLLQNADVAVFLAFHDTSPVGFAQCQLRHDYVEGTDSSPVGYLEGIFVLPECRKHGIARLLLGFCQQWAKEKGCTEFASDCELTNTDSQHFHLNVGFVEANRIICFTKKL